MFPVQECNRMEKAKEGETTVTLTNTSGSLSDRSTFPSTASESRTERPLSTSLKPLPCLSIHSCSPHMKAGVPTWSYCLVPCTKGGSKYSHAPQIPSCTRSVSWASCGNQHRGINEIRLTRVRELQLGLLVEICNPTIVEAEAGDYALKTPS